MTHEIVDGKLVVIREDQTQQTYSKADLESAIANTTALRDFNQQRLDNAQADLDAAQDLLDKFNELTDEN